MDDLPRNPKTGSLDVNDMTVYTGYAELPLKEIAAWKIWYLDGSDEQGKGNFTLLNKLVVYGVVKKLSGGYFYLEGHEHYFFDKDILGFTNDERECTGTIRMGGELPKREYDATVDAALKDSFTK